MLKPIGFFPTQKGELVVLVERCASSVLDYQRRVTVIYHQGDREAVLLHASAYGTHAFFENTVSLRIYAAGTNFRMIGTISGGVHNGGGSRETFYFDALGRQIEPIPSKDLYPLRDIPGVVENGVLTPLVRNAL